MRIISSPPRKRVIKQLKLVVFATKHNHLRFEARFIMLSSCFRLGKPRRIRRRELHQAGVLRFHCFEAVLVDQSMESALRKVAHAIALRCSPIGDEFVL